jgi:hypothetical protein
MSGYNHFYTNTISDDELALPIEDEHPTMNWTSADQSYDNMNSTAPAGFVQDYSSSYSSPSNGGYVATHVDDSHFGSHPSPSSYPQLQYPPAPQHGFYLSTDGGQQNVPVYHEESASNYLLDSSYGHYESQPLGIGHRSISYQENLFSVASNRLGLALHNNLRSTSASPRMTGDGHSRHTSYGSHSDFSTTSSVGDSRQQDLTQFGIPTPPVNGQGGSAAWRCAYAGCTSRKTFTRGCDLRKHFNRHAKTLFCSYSGCHQNKETHLAALAQGNGFGSPRGGFSSKKDMLRHEASHNPHIPCEGGCDKKFSRNDNMASDRSKTALVTFLIV